MIEKLDVILWGETVGTLVSSPNGYGRMICFYFNHDYLREGYDIAPLRAPLSGVVAQRSLPVYPEESKEFGGLPSFIADSMPDHWGNLVFAEWAKSKQIRTKDLTPLDRLAYIGRRGMGALEFVPPTSLDLENPFKIEIEELSRMAKKALAEAKSFRAAISPDFVIESLFKVGTSAGGRRPKAVVNVNLESGLCFSGQVPAPMPGFVPMIIKFDEHIGVPTTRIEYAYYLMAQEVGLNMMPSKLIKGEHEVHFLTERFDRTGNEKIHVQTLAAMNPLANSYEDMFDVAQRLGICYEEMTQLFMQLVMNVLCGNVDDHNKNFSFIMAKDGIWHVAPAYDFTFSVDSSAPFYVNRHSMTVNAKNQDITRDDLMLVASKFSIKGADSIIDKVINTVTHFRDFGDEAGLPGEWISIIEAEIDTRIKRFR